MKTSLRLKGLNLLWPFWTAFSLITTLQLTAVADPEVKAVLDRQQVGELQQWKSANPDVIAETAAEFPQYDWWRMFNDANLSRVVETALDNNPELKAAAVQIARAEAASKISRSSLLPSVSLAPQYTWEKLGKNQFFFPIQGRTYQVFQVPLNARWEIDLFGKNFAAYQSSRKGIQVARQQYEAARLQLTALVVATYFNVAKWRHLEAIASEELASSDRFLKHSRRLLDLGQSTLFDIQNSQQRRDQAQVNVTQFENNRELAENMLMALMGQTPTSFSPPEVTSLDALTYPEKVSTGVPSQLVLHRPDVAAVETQLAAAQLDIKAARRALLPSIVLNGSTGYNAVGVKNLFKWTSLSTFATATVAQQLYAGGRLRAQIRLEKADYQQLLNAYESALINAFTDAENSLATLHADQVVYQDVATQTENARGKAASRLARFRAGIEGEPLWLAEEVQRLEYEKQLAQQKTQLLVDVVSVAKAMGGGF